MESPNYIKFIELFKTEHPLEIKPTTMINNYYGCGNISCAKCPYEYGIDCIISRQNDFPQSLEYHRKTYPEDFV